MYWLWWHYHVKDIAGTPYEIKKKRKANKTTESPTVSSRGQTTVYCAVSKQGLFFLLRALEITNVDVSISYKNLLIIAR